MPPFAQFFKRTIPRALLLATVFLPSRHALAEPAAIQPGERWLDDRGKTIQAHGGGVTQVGDTYYWFGEDRSPDGPPGKR